LRQWVISVTGCSVPRGLCTIVIILFQEDFGYIKERRLIAERPGFLMVRGSLRLTRGSTPTEGWRGKIAESLRNSVSFLSKCNAPVNVAHQEVRRIILEDKIKKGIGRYTTDPFLDFKLDFKD